MQTRENYTPFFAVGFGLTLAIVAIFQIYLGQEPARIQRDEAADRLAAEIAGRDLYAENCVACHGENGGGEVGPALNSRQLLGMATDELLVSLIRTGVPGSLMPAWGQTFGGPFTDEQVTQIVAFIRSWEPTAPDIAPVVEEPDPERGAAIYARTCFICHDEDGSGAHLAPALNDMERLQQLDDAWYRNTISRGRPAKGMPTWGTVLSPAQINDLVALLAAWRAGETVTPEIPMETFVTSAFFAIRELDQPDAVFYLNAALALADSAQAEEIQAVIALIEDNQLYKAEGRLIALLPPEEMGKVSFDSNCAPCHGGDGTGGLGPNLHANPLIQSSSDEELTVFILAGRKGTAMGGFEGILGIEEISNIITLMRAWQE